MKPGPALSASDWLAEHGDALFAYAMTRLRDRHACEDLVQETLLAAWTARASFAGQSQLRTWLIGILRHKLIDRLRKNSREADSVAESSAASTFDFHTGWKKYPGSWGDPESRSREKELLQIIGDCRSQLPAHLLAALVVRDIDDVPVEEACKMLNLTATNLGVRLHRARMLLRDCVDANWVR
jgi:RNA polymerase sigma-70 factor (TIGR02943 family)